MIQMNMRGTALALMLWAALSTPITADVSFPDTPAGQVAQKRLKAFNAGDVAALEAFKKAHEPEMNVQQELAFRQMTGGFEVLRVDGNGPDEVTVILREQDGDRVGSMGLRLDKEQRVERFHLTPMAVVPAELMPARVSEDVAWERLVQKAERFVTNEQFAGTFAVGRDGQVRRTRSWGESDRERGTKNDVNTRFRVGSMYKMFTAVAVLRLVEQGRISLDASLKTYLPDYPNAALADAVRIRHLLTHTGGTGDIFTAEYNAQRESIREHADYLRLFGARATDFVPGSDESYSNYGYVLLGAVIERVSGQSYHAFVQEHVFKPAGMQNTGAEPEEKARDGISIGYTQSENGWVDNRNLLPWRGTAAGGGYSTVGDLLRFGDALLKGRLLSAKTLAEATHAQAPSGIYGFGFQLGGDGDTRQFGHSGGAEGMNGALRIYPATGDVVVALGNIDPPAAEALVEYYGNRMPLKKTSAGK